MASDSDRIVNLSRRDFLKTGAGLVLGVWIPIPAAQAQADAVKGGAAFEPNAFVRIGADNSVTVIAKHLGDGAGHLYRPRRPWLPRNWTRTGRR